MNFREIPHLNPLPEGEEERAKPFLVRARPASIRITIISLVAVIIASCSRRFDSQSNNELEKPKNSNDVADHDGIAHSKSKPSTQGPHQFEDRESQSQPSADDISEDCRAFVWLTKALPRDGANADCPQCPSSTEAKQVLNFQAAQVERVSCAAETCEVAVAIHAN